MIYVTLVKIFLIGGISCVCSAWTSGKLENHQRNLQPNLSKETSHTIQEHVISSRSTCQRPPDFIPQDDDITKLSLWELLKKTEQDLTIHTGDAIVLLGNTGSGKTTVVQYVTNMSNLYVYETSGEELIIVDPEQTIGITTASRTLVPVLIPDHPNSLYYFDFPGFSDNRGTNADVIANYLMKKVTDSLSSVRLAFIVIQSAVEIGNDKRNFDYLVLSAIQMVRNLEKIDAGIGMIITKVKNYNARGQFREDNVILDGIIDFLKQYKKDEEEKLNQVRMKGQRRLRATQRELIERKIRFVEILLQPKRIWFLRQPEDCGPLNETSWAAENQEAMITLMRDDLKSVPTTKDDFGYAVTDQTILQVHSLYKDLNSYVTSNISSVVSNIRTSHFQNTLTIREFFSQAQWISNDLGNFTKVIDSFQNNSKSPGHLSELISSTIDLRRYDQQWGLQLKTEMQRIESYMDFFDEVNKDGSSFPREGTNWILPLRNWVNELSQRNEWFNFLGSLRKVLSSYNFQKKPKPSSRPSDISGVKKLLKEDDYIVTSSIISIYDKKESILDQDIDIMWTIVEEAIEATKVSCDKSTNQMTIQGSFVKSSDFTESSGSYSGCTFTPLKVSVYATRLVYFDRDIAPHKLEDASNELAILSPKWEVVIQGNTKHKIDLGGKPGQTYSRTVTSVYRNRSREIISTLPSAMMGICNKMGLVANGSDGSNGSPGEPGHPGGNFIGIAGEVQNGNTLKVVVSGGAGGSGQAGTSGGFGEMGKSLDNSTWEQCTYIGPCLGNGDCPTKPGKCSNTEKWGQYFDICYRNTDGGNVVDCDRGGCLGGRGGNGGDGGAGGQGGFRGKVSVIEASGSKSTGGIQIEDSTGTNGKAGSGGSAGLGGRRGDGEKAGIWQGGGCYCWWEDWKPLTYVQITSPDGTEGQTGGNSQGSKDPTEPNFTYSHLQRVLNYKSFALPKETDVFPNEFIAQLETIPEVTQQQSPIRLAQELLILEESNLNLKNAEVGRESLALQLIPHYESFLRRLDSFTLSNENGSKSLKDADRKLISLLYTMGLNQLRNLRMVFGSPVIVNVAGYLESVRLRLGDYEKKQMKVMVAEEESRYKETFYEKIEQAMVLLVETVNPALNETYGEIAEVTDQLLEAVEKMIEAAEAAEKEYKFALQKMKKTMGLRSLFNIFRIGGTALSILGGPVGGSVGSIIGSVSSLGEGLALNSGGSLRPPTPLPSSIKKYAEEMERKNKATSQERQDELSTLIEESRIAVKENVETLKVVETKIVQLEEKKKILLEKGPKSSMKQFKDLDKKVKESEAELKESLESRVKHLEKAMEGLEGTSEEKEVADKFGKKAIEAIKHVESTVKVVSTLGLSIYTAHKKDKKEIARLSMMVDEAHQQIQDFKKYEEAVEELLTPFTNSIIAEMDEAAQGMANQSPVLLRVTEWKVQKTLREYNFFLQDFSQAFPDVAKQYALQVENLKEAMTLMIDLYDYIQQYNQQMQFADYIANINSPRALQASLGEPANSLYEKIDLAMQASLILTEWHRVIQTFQQWVYPFHDAFKGDLKTSGIPDYMKPAVTSVSEMHGFLIPDIKNRVTNLIASLKAYKSAAFEAVDGVLIHSEFNSEKVSTVPFHVWKVEDEERRIKKLLLDKPVAFSVTPDFTYQRRISAVKFTIAEIEPKARNKTLQAEFKEKLNNLRVSMTHSGVSRYLHQEQMEEMVGGNLTIQYNFERDNDGERLGKNNVYKKLETGDLILSPYTQWSVQLRKAQDDLPFDFEKFAEYSSAVDLELIGKGSFVRQQGTRKAFSPVPLQYFTERTSPFGMFQKTL